MRPVLGNFTNDVRYPDECYDSEIEALAMMRPLSLVTVIDGESRDGGWTGREEWNLGKSICRRWGHHREIFHVCINRLNLNPW